MGQYAKGLMAQVVAQTAVEAVSSLMENAQMLGGLARAVIEEDCADLVNPNQLIEAAARCVDTIELVVLACGAQNAPESTRLNRDIRKTKKKLNSLRKQLLDIAAEE